MPIPHVMEKVNHACARDDCLVTCILNGERPVSADTALRLARYFGTSAEVWVRLQASHDLRVAMRDTSEEIERIARAPREAA